MASVASAIDAVAGTALKVRGARMLRAFRLEARPSSAEWTASILLGVLGLATPLAAWIVFDRLVPLAGRADAGWALALLMLGAAAFVTLEAGVRYARVHLADSAERVRETLRAARALSRLAAAPLNESEEAGAPARAARLAAAAAFIELRTGGLRRAVLDLPYALVALAGAVAIGQWAALAPCVLVAGVIFLFAVSSPYAAQAARARDSHDARSDDFISECAAHLSVLKGAAMEPFFVRRMEQLLASGRDHEWRRIRASDRAEDLSSLLEAATVLAVAAVGGVMALNGSMTVGALIATMLLAAGTVRPVVRVAAAAQRAAALGPEHELDDNAADAPVRPATQPAALVVDAKVAGVTPRIRFEAPFGATIAITSHDGAAMSAVLRVAAGLEAPESGVATIGAESATLHRLAHPGGVALVTPRAVLLSGTVLENLTLFGQGATEAQALAACDALGLRPAIDRLSRGLETPVGEGVAEEVSGSLAHRLCIARAIALGPRVLLLDEPQSRLDPAEDRRLLAGLASLRGRMTIIMATSRPSYLALADKTYVVDGGRFSLMANTAPPRVAARRAGVA